jgi:hypothetical protein
MELVLADVALPLKIAAAIAVFGPVIVFVRFLIRAAFQDGEIQKERERGGSGES